MKARDDWLSWLFALTVKWRGDGVPLSPVSDGGERLLAVLAFCTDSGEVMAVPFLQSVVKARGDWLSWLSALTVGR